MSRPAYIAVSLSTSALPFAGCGAHWSRKGGLGLGHPSRTLRRVPHIRAAGRRRARAVPSRRRPSPADESAPLQSRMVLRSPESRSSGLKSLHYLIVRVNYIISPGSAKGSYSLNFDRFHRQKRKIGYCPGIAVGVRLHGVSRSSARGRRSGSGGYPTLACVLSRDPAFQRKKAFAQKDGRRPQSQYLDCIVGEHR